jgi:hypothetical protein
MQNHSDERAAHRHIEDEEATLGEADPARLPVANADPELIGAVDKDYGQVRPSGPASMRDDPGEWDVVDEGSDESFPASDPPSYMPG